MTARRTEGGFWWLVQPLEKDVGEIRHVQAEGSILVSYCCWDK